MSDKEAAKSSIVVSSSEPVAQHAVTPMDMIQMAIEQNADVDKLTKLFELKERYDAAEAKKAFDMAMSRFREKCPVIFKNKEVDFTSPKGRTNYRHADLSGMVEQVRPIMAECGLSHSWRTRQENGVVFVTCIITHSAGHSESTEMLAPYDTSGNKNPIQAIGSATTYLQRYTLAAILGLASSEDDDGAASGPAVDVDGIITLLETATSLAQLDARAQQATKLTGEDIAKARDAYKLRKEELSQ
jgi:ERF superfamily